MTIGSINLNNNNFIYKNNELYKNIHKRAAYIPHIAENKNSTKNNALDTAKIISGVATITISALLLLKGKINSKQLKSFQPAETIKDALKFSKKNLGVNYQNTELANLDMINSINEMLFKEKNYSQDIPKLVKFVGKNKLSPHAPMAIEQIKGKPVLLVNTDTFKNFDEIIEYCYQKHLSKFISRDNGIYKLSDFSYKSPNMDEFIEKLNAYNKNSTFLEKTALYDGISSAISVQTAREKGINLAMRKMNSSADFIHEMGHYYHQKIYADYEEAGGQMTDIRKEWSQLLKIKNDKTAYKVSSYAASSPLEFVAEVYKELRLGEKYDASVMDLYKKYCGPIV